MIKNLLSNELNGTRAPATALNHALPLTLRIEGMQCTSCSAQIERELQHTPGVLEATVFFLSDTAQLTYEPHAISPQEVLAKITRLGYRPSLHEERSAHASGEEKLFLRMGIALVLTFNVMMLSHVLYGGFFQELSLQAVRYVSAPLLVITSVIIFYFGFPIIRKGLTGFYALRFNMDSLITTGTLSAYSYSVIQMLQGSIHLYFDTASMLVSLVLLGRYIESRSKEKVAGFMSQLYAWAHHKVRIGSGSHDQWIAPDRLAPGDHFQAAAGERIPLDARVVSGKALLDQSILTGEAKPVRKDEGAEVMGGSLILSGAVTLEVLRAGRDCFLGQMIELTEQALSKKSSMELIADRIMQWLVPAVLSIAAAAAIYLLLDGSTAEAALLRSISVLVVTCPCALGIAVPLAKTAFISSAREKGIVVRSPDALEQAELLDTLVFDKTGTLTCGLFSLQKTVTEEASEDEALSRVASIEINCDHYLAREIVRSAMERALPFHTVTGYKNLEGLGVRGLLNGEEIVAGNRALACEAGFHLGREVDEEARALEAQGKTVVFFGWGKKIRGCFSFGDALKSSAPQTIQGLHARGINLWLVSGDASVTTRFVADTLGISHYRGDASPREKVLLIKELEQQGKKVGMVGDGINDSPALTGAAVGLSIGTRAPFTQQAADVVLLTDDPNRLLDFLNLSAMTMRTIRQNLFFAFIYNAVAIPLALTGLVNPLIAVCAMFASSLTVTGNTLRIFWKQKR